jgi:hypothetical protein
MGGYIGSEHEHECDQDANPCTHVLEARIERLEKALLYLAGRPPDDDFVNPVVGVKDIIDGDSPDSTG